MLLQQSALLTILYVLCACTSISHAYVPVVYPSLIERHGFVYHEESRKVLSLPGGIEPLLCRKGRRATFEAADRDCSNVVVFTSSDSITFQLLNLSQNGVILPFSSRPQVDVSIDDDHIRWSAYGSAGLLDIDAIGRETSSSIDHDEGEHDAEASLEPDSGITEGTETDAESSLAAVDDEDLPEIDIGEDDEDESLTMHELARELPDSVTPPGRDSIDISVLDANATVGFLHPNGTIKADRTLLVELHMDDLPANELIPVRIQFGRGIRRRVFVYRDTSPATARIRLVRNSSRRQSNSRKAHFQYRVDFSGYVFNTPNRDLLECSDVREPLLKFSAQHLTRGSGLGANDLRSMLVASRQFSLCSSQIATFVPEELVRVTGVSAEMEGARSRLRLANLRRGKPGQTTVLISFEVNLKRRTRLEINVRPSAGVNLAGEPVERQSEMYTIERRNRATQRAVDRADDIGTTSTVVASTSVATSVSVTVGASMAISVSGSAATGGAGGVTAGGSVSGAIDLLSLGQRIYLVTQMGVPNMPENFEAFGESLSWTMLDMEVPWRENSEVQTLYRYSNDTVEEEEGEMGGEETDIVVFKREWPYQRLVLALFWTLTLFVCLVVLHCICVAFFFTFHYPLPDKLRFPRLELYFLHWVTPAIAGACASLFTGNENQVILGIVLLVAIPIAFVLWHVYILVSAFLKKPEKYRVFYEVQKEVASKKNLGTAYGEVGTDADEAERRANLRSDPQQHSFIERYLLTPLLGSPYPCGDWKTVEGPSNKFVDRFGPVFEEYRHIPGRRRNATFDVSANANRVERGHFLPFHRSWTSRRVVNIMQVSGAVLSLSRMIFIACFVLGQDDPSNNSQGITLLILSIVYLITLRILRPHNERWLLGLVLLEEILNIATYCIVLYLLNNDEADKQEVRRNLGFLMICFEGVGFFLIICEQIHTSLAVIKLAARGVLDRFKKDPQILEVIMKAQLQNPRYLERKYFRKWVKYTLGRGVYPGVLMRDKNVPFEELFWADPSTALRQAMVPSCLGERKKSLESAKNI